MSCSKDRPACPKFRSFFAAAAASKCEKKWTLQQLLLLLRRRRRQRLIRLHKSRHGGLATFFTDNHLCLTSRNQGLLCNSGGRLSAVASSSSSLSTSSKFAIPDGDAADFAGLVTVMTADWLQETIDLFHTHTSRTLLEVVVTEKRSGGEKRASLFSCENLRAATFSLPKLAKAESENRMRVSDYGVIGRFVVFSRFVMRCCC